jgi:Protein of unknown function (DUF5132)
LGPLVPPAVTLLVGVLLGVRGKKLVQAAGRPVGRVARPALRATIRESLLLSRAVQHIAESAGEDIKDLTAEARAEVAARDVAEPAEHTRPNAAR